MRLPRKFNRALPRQETLRPAMAARTELARGEVVSTAGDVAADFTLKMRDAKDAADLAELEGRAAVSMSEWENTDFGDDLDAMREDFERRRAEIEGSTGTLRSGGLKKKTDQALKTMFDLAAIDVEAKIQKKAIAAVDRKTLVAANNLAELGQFEGARNVIEARFNTGVIDEVGKQKEMQALRNSEIQFEAQEIDKEIDAAYGRSPEEGEKAFQELVGAEGMDDQVKALAVDLAERTRIEHHKARETERKEMETQAVLAYGDDMARASLGDISREEIEASYKSGKYGEGSGAAQRRNSLLNRYVSGLQKQTDILDVSAIIQAGERLPTGAKYQRALDSYLQTVMEGKSPEEQMQILADISATAGTVSANTEHLLKGASVSKEGLRNASPYFDALTSIEGSAPDLHIDANTRTLLESYRAQVRAGADPERALDAVWDNAHMDETQRRVMDHKWKNVGSEASQAAWDDLPDMPQYGGQGFNDFDADDPDDLPKEMQVNYEDLYREAYYQSGGDAGVAKAVADQEIQRNWTVTNINGDNEVQKWGIPDDSKHIRADILNDLQGEYRISVGGGYVISEIDPDEVRFEVVSLEHGNRRLVAFQNGQMIQNADGSVPDIIITPKDLKEKVAKSQEIDVLKERRDEIQYELFNLRQDNPWLTDKARKERARRITQLENEMGALGGD